MAFKYDLKTVTEFINNTGYSLISTNYINSQKPLNIKCPNGHNIFPCFSEFKRKARCNECSTNKSPTIESIQEFIKPKGFILLSTNYINNNTKLSVKCTKDHVWNVHWNNLKNGSGCPNCYGNKKHTVDEIREYLKPFNYTLIQTTFKNVGYLKYNKPYKDFIWKFT